MREAQRLGGGPAGHAGQRSIETLNGVGGVHDQDAVGGPIQDRIKPLFFLGGLLVEARVVHGDGGLVGEAGQQSPVVGGKGRGIAAKDCNFGILEKKRDKVDGSSVVERSYLFGAGRPIRHYSQSCRNFWYVDRGSQQNADANHSPRPNGRRNICGFRPLQRVVQHCQ